MTVYESIMIVLGVIDIMVAFGSLLIALLNFLRNKRNNKHK